MKKMTKLIKATLIAATALMGVAGAQERTVLVTGANRGLGLGWVKHFAAAGDTVIATCRKPAEAKDLNELASKSGGKVSVEALDVVDEASIASLAGRLDEKGIKIDLAMNNAGVVDEEPFGEWTKKSFELNLWVNTIGPALVSQMLVPRMNDGSMLVNISSGAGCIKWHNKSNDLDAYGASKAALNHLTKRLGVKLKERKIIVIAINPGMVLTDMNPEGTTSIEEAVKQMSAALESYTLENSGGFFNYTGKQMEW